jgi:hypothetical protein
MLLFPGFSSDSDGGITRAQFPVAVGAHFPRGSIWGPDTSTEGRLLGCQSPGLCERARHIV